MKQINLKFVFLFFSIFSFSQSPPNDLIENAVDISSLPFVDVNVQTQFATTLNSDSLPCDFNTNFSRVYYRFVPDVDITFTAALSNGNINSSFITFHQSSVPFPITNSELSLINGEVCEFSTVKTFDLIANEVYYVLIGNQQSATDIVFYDSFNSEIVNIPDANFKNKLINNLYDTIDLNGNEEIEIVEAQLASDLDVRTENGQNDKISDLTGLETFTNLKTLSVENNLITSYDFSIFPNLERLIINKNLFTQIDVTQNTLLKAFYCESNQISDLDISQNVLLESLFCNSNQLLDIDVSQNILLEDLFCYSNQISDLDVSQNLLLRYIWCHFNQITILDVTENINLEQFSCYNNLISVLDVTQNLSLTWLNCNNNSLENLDVSQNNSLSLLNCGGNQLTSLDVSQNSLLETLICANSQLSQLDISSNPLLDGLACNNNQLTDIDLSENPLLEVLIIGNNNIESINLEENDLLNLLNVNNSYFLESLNVKNGNNSLLSSFAGEVGLKAENCPNLQTICVDDIGYAIVNLNTFVDPQTIFVEDCNATTVDYNIIMGQLTFDENENGCDSNDTKIPNTLITATDGVNTFSTFTNINGEYAIDVVENTYSTAPSGLSALYTATPNAISNVFTGFGNVETADFCTTINQSVYDVSVTLLPLSEARPGFDSTYQIVFENLGLTANSGSVIFQFDDAKQVFINAAPTENASTSNTLTFDYTNLLPFETRVIDIAMNTFTPPIVNGDDVLNFMTTISISEADVNLDDNTFILEQVVVNSFDPNDKQVLQGSQIFIEEADNYLDYLIRFQNTGTASAINVVITDELDERLDWNTIQPTSSSHTFQARITNGDFVEFIFENINLPAEQDDAVGSNGFIAFKIKPKSDAIVGDIISGEAKIYFDFNTPIITNTVSTEIVDTLSNEEVLLEDNDIKIYPNPTTGIVFINANASISVKSITIFNLKGQLLKTVNNSELHLDINDFTSGIYILEIQTNKGSINKRLIKS